MPYIKSIHKYKKVLDKTLSDEQKPDIKAYMADKLAIGTEVQKVVVTHMRKSGR